MPCSMMPKNTGMMPIQNHVSQDFKSFNTDDSGVLRYEQTAIPLEFIFVIFVYLCILIA